MSLSLDGFPPDIRKAVWHAEESAGPSGAITSLHLLHGLLQEPESEPRRYLAGQGVDAERLLGALQGAIAAHHPTQSSRFMLVQSYLYCAMDLARNEALNTGHLLRALLADHDCAAAQFLRAVGVKS